MKLLAFSTFMFVAILIPQYANALWGLCDVLCRTVRLDLFLVLYSVFVHQRFVSRLKLSNGNSITIFQIPNRQITFASNLLLYIPAPKGSDFTKGLLRAVLFSILCKNLSNCELDKQSASQQQ